MNYKCIQLVDKFQLGGAEQVALTYNKCLKELGHRTELIGIKASNDHDSILVTNYFAYLAAIITIYFQHFTHSKVVLFAHTTRSLIMGILARILTFGSIKLIFIQHLNHPEKKVKSLSRLAVFCNKYLQITPITKTVYERFIPPSKQMFINNFIIEGASQETNEVSLLIKSIQEEADGRAVITFIGAMRKPGKNPADILNLANYLPENDYYFVIVGDGKGGEVDKFKSALSSYEKEHINVKWVGYQKNTKAFLEISDYLFFSSYNSYEMMPMTVLEGMQSNTTVVGYDLEICQFLLPQENVFTRNDFENISKSIIDKKLVSKENLYDLEYGKRKMTELLRCIVK